MTKHKNNSLCSNNIYPEPVRAAHTGRVTGSNYRQTGRLTGHHLFPRLRWYLMIMGSFLFSAVIAQKPEHNSPGKLFSLDKVDISAMIQPIPAKNVFSDSAYNIWCGSVVEGRNGKFYMLYSRWPRKLGHYAWVSNSEIALAKADHPEGPFHHVKVVLKARGNSFWDGVCTHNAYAVARDGRIYLFYMGTTGKSMVNQPASSADPAWWEYRNHQRIGVAVADDPEGEWTRFDHPILSVSSDSTAYDALLVSNPAVTVDQTGKVILVYKQVEKNGTFKGGKVRFGVAFAKSLLGPFVKYRKPIFEAKSEASQEAWMVAEDPFIWNDHGVNYAIVTDVAGYFTNREAALAFLQSPDGIHWAPARYPKVAPWRLKFADGSMADDKLERPCLYFKNGVPHLLYGALGMKNRSFSVNVAIPLQ